MCLKGGPRCENDVRPRLAEVRLELASIEESLTQLRSVRATLQSGKSVKTENGGYRRIYGVEKEMRELTVRKLAAKAREESTLHEWQLTNKGIQELRNAGDTALASKRAAERQAILELNKKNLSASRHLRRVMEREGFSPDDISECDISPGGSPYPLPAATYLERREKHEAKIKAVSTEGEQAIKNAATDKQRASIEAKYVRRLAGIAVLLREANHGYFTTEEGVAELKKDAEEPGITFTQQLIRQGKYERYAGIKDERQSDKRLRDIRRRNIRRVYRKAGLDPTEALKTHGLTDEQMRDYIPEEIKKTRSMSIRYTEAEYKSLCMEFEASGEETLDGFLEKKYLVAPAQNFQGIELSELNAGVKKEPEGHHRQRTVPEGDNLRSKVVTLKVSQHTFDLVSKRAKALHTTKSSLQRTMTLGQDPRIHSNDRSIKVNQKRTEKVLHMMQSGKLPA